MKWQKGLICIFPALPLLVACATLTPTFTFNGDLAFPPRLSSAQSSGWEPGGEEPTLASMDSNGTSPGHALAEVSLNKLQKSSEPAAFESSDLGKHAEANIGQQGPIRLLTTGSAPTVLTPRSSHPRGLLDTAPPLQGESATGWISPLDYGGKLKTGVVTSSIREGDAFSIAAAFSPSSLLSVKTSFVERPAMGIESVLGLEDQKAGLDVRADSYLMNGKLRAYGQWDYSAFDPRTAYKFGQDSQRMFKVGLEGREGQLSYGARHGFAGNDYKTEFKANKKKEATLKPGKEETAFWARWGFGDLGVKTSVSESWDNLENDPDKPRIMDTRAGATLEYTFSSWPYVGYSLGYFRGTRSSSQEPLGYSRHEEPMDRLESTLDYAGGSWSASLYESYARVTQAQRSSSLPTSTLTHYLSASFYPIDSFSITPALGYYDQNYSQLRARTVNRSASLAMLYQPVGQNIRYTAFGSYDSESNRTWDIEKRSYYIDGGLIWSLGDSSMARNSLSLGFAYNRYMDAVYSESNSEDLSLWLVFRVGSSAFPRVTPQFLFEE